MALLPQITPQAIHMPYSSYCWEMDHPDILFAEGRGKLIAPPLAVTEEQTLLIRYQWKAGERYFVGEGSVTNAGHGWVWSLVVAPVDNAAWVLAGTSEGSGRLCGWRETELIRIFHGDNIRGASLGGGLFDGRYFISPDEWQRPLNSGRWLAFPGMWLRDRSMGFVMGVLSQHQWKHTLMKGAVEETCLRLDGRMRPPGIDVRHFASGESYLGEELYMEWTDQDRPEHAFAGYLNTLETRLAPCKSRSLLRHSAFWDSWNDRQPCHWDVSEPLVLRTMELLSARFPTVRSIEIDDGYMHGGFYEADADRWTLLEMGLNPDSDSRKIRRVRKLGIGFMAEPDLAISTERFPRGMPALAESISDSGYLPAIWLGLNVVHDARMVCEHPEWFIRCVPVPEGDPELLTVFGAEAKGGARVLDPSVPEVRLLLEKTAALLLGQWGYKALKLDFWSYAFECEGFRLQYPQRTAYEWRAWLLNLLRSHLPSESYFVVGCDISTGNPFLSPWVDNIRYGIDIGNGRWENIRYSAFTGTFLLHIEAYRFFILNSDSLGLLRKLQPMERQVFWTWVAATRSSCEIAGDLAFEAPDSLRPLQKLLLAPKNGDPAVVVGTGHLQRDEPAAVVWSKGDLFSRCNTGTCLPEGLLAVFNWSENPQRVEIDPSALGMPDSEILDANFFESEVVYRKGRWTVELPPRSARLCHLSVWSGAPLQIIDSAWKVTGMELAGKGDLSITLEGESPEGVLLALPDPSVLTILSSLPCEIVEVAEGALRLKPYSCEETTQEWTLSIHTPQK